eukprot:6851161-Prymnesium_polylepis.1
MLTSMRFMIPFMRVSGASDAAVAVVRNRLLRDTCCAAASSSASRSLIAARVVPASSAHTAEELLWRPNPQPKRHTVH